MTTTPESTHPGTSYYTAGYVCVQILFRNANYISKVVPIYTVASTEILVNT